MAIQFIRESSPYTWFCSRVSGSYLSGPDVFTSGSESGNEMHYRPDIFLGLAQFFQIALFSPLLERLQLFRRDLRRGLCPSHSIVFPG